MIQYNQNGVNFKIDSPDINLSGISSLDVISLEVTEEMSKIDSGIVRFYDANGKYSRLLRPGAKLRVSWGVQNRDGSEVKRNPIEVMVNAPSGGGDARGVTTYDCTFMAVGFRGGYGIRHYDSGSRGSMVADVMARLGVSRGDMRIDFQGMDERLVNGTKVTQYESDFRFLVRMADENRAAFHIGIARVGMARPVAIFVDYGKLRSYQGLESINSSLALEYGGAGANVSSYRWADNSLDSMNGQGARIVMIDGKPVVYRTIVEGETVKTYRLVPELIEAELSRLGLEPRTSLVMEFLSVKDFAQVERFFTVDTSSTAPQGSGIEVSAEVVGDPYITQGMVATFGSGFPARIGATDRTWWVQQAVHKIGNGDYNTTVKIKDAYSFSETGVKLALVGGGSL